MKTGEALFGRVSEVDPYQESSPALPRALSEADRFTAWRLAVASPSADRQTGRKARRRRTRPKEKRLSKPRIQRRLEQRFSIIPEGKQHL